MLYKKYTCFGISYKFQSSQYVTDCNKQTDRPALLQMVFFLWMRVVLTSIQLYGKLAFFKKLLRIFHKAKMMKAHYYHSVVKSTLVWRGFLILWQETASCACLVRSGLKLIFRWVSRSLIFFKSSLRLFVDVFELWTTGKETCHQQITCDLMIKCLISR